MIKVDLRPCLGEMAAALCEICALRRIADEEDRVGQRACGAERKRWNFRVISALR